MTTGRINQVTILNPALALTGTAREGPPKGGPEFVTRTGCTEVYPARDAASVNARSSHWLFNCPH